MEIEVRDGRIHFILETDEARGVEYDYGEGEFCIPCEDLIGVAQEFSAALGRIVTQGGMEVGRG